MQTSPSEPLLCKETRRVVGRGPGGSLETSPFASAGHDGPSPPPTFLQSREPERQGKAGQVSRPTDQLRFGKRHESCHPSAVPSALPCRTDGHCPATEGSCIHGCSREDEVNSEGRQETRKEHAQANQL